MTKLPRTLRLDASDGVVFPRAAEAGEWAIPGGFVFWDDTDDTLTGKRRQAFRAGFLGLGSFGWSTLVEVAEASFADRRDALDALAAHILAEHGAPDMDAARAAAEEEVAFAESLCAEHAPGIALALERRVEDGDIRERFRTLHLRAQEHRSFNALPVFGVVQVDGEDVAEEVDLTKL
ncbi:MAG: DUF6505 family protein [Alphaproteobacteria bacterium]|nr:DUF6505 family protein [Alphaproteobacteria bacterium]